MSASLRQHTRCFVQRGYTQFVPHYMVQRCLEDSRSQACADDCINHGRYCAMDSIPTDLQGRYKGRQVLVCKAARLLYCSNLMLALVISAD